MNGHGEDILVFLDAAITARETTARSACHESSGQWTANDYGHSYSVKDDNDDVVVYNEGAPSMPQADHIALNDPASVLRRCAADRKLLASHQPTEGIGFDPDDDTPGTYGEIASACSSCGTVDEYAVRFPCHVVRLLAEGYGWTEGER